MDKNLNIKNKYTSIKKLKNLIEYQIKIKKSSFEDLIKICRFYGFSSSDSIKYINDANTKIVKGLSDKKNKNCINQKNKIYFNPKTKKLKKIQDEIKKIYDNNHNITKNKNLNILYDYAIKKGLTRSQASKIINKVNGKTFKIINSMVQGGKASSK